MIRSRLWLCLLIGAMFVVGVRGQEAVRLGNTAFEEGRYEKAITHYERALNEEPTFAVHVNLGHACMKLERWADAAAHYRAAIDLDATSVTPEIWLFLGQAYYQTAQYDEALDAFVQAASPKSEGPTGLWIAQCLIDLEQWWPAKLALQNHLSTHPKDAKAIELLAHVLGQMTDWPSVITTYRHLLTVAPDETAYRVALGNALAGQGRHAEAVDTLELAWRLDPAAAEQVSRLLADLYLAEQMPHEAALCYTRIVRPKERGTADDYYRQALAYFQGKEFASAEAALLEMREIDPADARADLYLGHVATEQDRPDEAGQYYQAALDKDANSTDALLALAQGEMQQQRYASAADHFAQAIASGDQRPVVYYHHVLALLQASDTAERIESALKAALAQHPADAQLQQLLDRYVRQTNP